MVWDISMVLMQTCTYMEFCLKVSITLHVLDSLSDIQSVQKRIQRLAGPS